MPRWRKIVSFLLLALWLPAVMHCQLEAAGVLPETCGHEAAGRGETEPCADDGCSSIEEGVFKPSGGALKFSAAPLLTATGFTLFSADDMTVSSHEAVSVAAMFTG